MSERYRFRPGSMERLEERIVLSGARIVPVAVRTLATASKASTAQAAVDQVNQAFDSLSRDYLQAQSAYLAPSSAGDTTSGYRQEAFRSYVEQRIQLLAGQLTRIFAHVPGSFNTLPSNTFGSNGGGSYVLQRFLRTRIVGPTSQKTDLMDEIAGKVPGTNAIPPANADQATVSLYTYRATTAIETARTNTLNSVGFLLAHTFENGKPNKK